MSLFLIFYVFIAFLLLGTTWVERSAPSASHHPWLASGWECTHDSSYANDTCCSVWCSYARLHAHLFSNSFFTLDLTRFSLTIPLTCHFIGDWFLVCSWFSGISDCFTATGRITMHKPNLHCVPKPFTLVSNPSQQFAVRSLVIAPAGQHSALINKQNIKRDNPQSFNMAILLTGRI